MVSKADKDQDEGWSLPELLMLCEFLDGSGGETSESRPRRSLRELSFEELVEELSRDA